MSNSRIYRNSYATSTLWELGDGGSMTTGLEETARIRAAEGLPG